MITPYLLKGNFDVLITGGCTLNCKGCSYIDYMDMGNTICNVMKFEEFKNIIQKLIKNNLKLESITILGGEPTIHPEYLKFIQYLYTFKHKIYSKLIVHTNGTNLGNDFINSLDYIDVVKFSFYPISYSIYDKLISSKLYDFIISKKVKIVIKKVDKFFDYGNKRDDLEYSKKLNWQRCFMKKSCRVLTQDKIFRCPIAFNNNEEGQSYDRDKIIKYIENDIEPMNLCENCPFPPKEKKWETNNKDVDIKNVERGLKIIDNLNIKSYKLI